MSIQPYHLTLLHVLGSHASFGWISMPRGASRGETLHRGPRAVYPYLTLRTTVDRWSFIPSFARLCHRYMESQGLAHLIARFPPVDPRCEFPLHHFMRASSHAREERHAPVRVDIVYPTLPPHFTTCARVACKFWMDSDAPRRLPRRNPSLWAPCGLPLPNSPDDG